MLKKLIPNIILDCRNKFMYKKRRHIHQQKMESIFLDIYKHNSWGSNETVSGQGSSVHAAQNVISSLPKLLKLYNITSILDIPCGDFNWMKKVNLQNIHYIGADIVPQIIMNNQKYGASNISFKQLNIVSDNLPPVDLVIVRDCFVHFSYEEINKAIKNIKRSNAKYLLTTSFKKCYVNYNIQTGDWRPLNLEKRPFKFHQPIYCINEYYHKKFKKASRMKQLALWEVSKLPRLPNMK